MQLGRQQNRKRRKKRKKKEKVKKEKDKKEKKELLNQHDATTLLKAFAAKCTRLKIEHHLLTSTSTHIGQLLCEAAEQKQVNFLVLGRRDMSKMHRLVSTSVSKYCLENAPCNIIVSKTLPTTDDEEVLENFRKLEEESRVKEALKKELASKEIAENIAPPQDQDKSPVLDDEFEPIIEVPVQDENKEK